MSAGEKTRRWHPDWPCPAGRILRIHRRGAGDPTYTITGDGSIWRAINTPVGPATLQVSGSPAELVGRAWGEGGDWVLEQLPALLGAEDDVSDFEPRHPVLVEAWRRYGDHRFSRSGVVMEALLPAIIEQKVTGQEAFRGFRDLVRRYGAPAPGPVPDGARPLLLQPTAAVLRAVPSWGWLQVHIDPPRSKAIVRAAQVAEALQRTIEEHPTEAERRLRTLPGIGRWTCAEVRTRAFGDADAPAYGDYHVAKDIGWALTGEPFDDAQLEAYLEPWAGHRGRVQALVGLAGLRRPRHGARMAPRTHLPARPDRR